MAYNWRDVLDDSEGGVTEVLGMIARDRVRRPKLSIGDMTFQALQRVARQASSQGIDAEDVETITDSLVTGLCASVASMSVRSMGSEGITEAISTLDQMFPPGSSYRDALEAVGPTVIDAYRQAAQEREMYGTSLDTGALASHSSGDDDAGATMHITGGREADPVTGEMKREMAELKQQLQREGINPDVLDGDGMPSDFNQAQTEWLQATYRHLSNAIEESGGTGRTEAGELYTDWMEAFKQGRSFSEKADLPGGGMTWFHDTQAPRYDTKDWTDAASFIGGLGDTPTSFERTFQSTGRTHTYLQNSKGRFSGTKRSVEARTDLLRIAAQKASDLLRRFMIENYDRNAPRLVQPTGATRKMLASAQITSKGDPKSGYSVVFHVPTEERPQRYDWDRPISFAKQFQMTFFVGRSRIAKRHLMVFPANQRIDTRRKGRWHGAYEVAGHDPSAKGIDMALTDEQRAAILTEVRRNYVSELKRSLQEALGGV